MFKHNKYTTWYFNIINKAKSENRIKSNEQYFEAHHIIPECIQTNNDVVLLTAREHYIAHCCLVNCVEDQFKNKMKAALSKMQCFNKNLKGRSSLSYVMSRKMMLGANNPMFGKSHTQEAKMKISNKNKGNTYRLGKQHSDETKQKVSIANKGNTYRLGKQHSDETKQKLSKINKVKMKEYFDSLTPEEKSKKFGSAKGKTWYYDKNTFKRYYGVEGTQPKGFIKGFVVLK